MAQRLTVTPATVPQATRGESYNQSFSATGGVAPYSWKISGLPPGLKAAGSTITGSPTMTGSFSVTVEATDNTKPKELSGTVKPTLLVVAPPLEISPSTAPAATVGVPYSLTFSGSGGTTPYTITITGSVPGLTATGARISGTPTAAGSYSVTARVTDRSSPSQTATVDLSIVVAPTLGISPASAPTGTVGLPYSATFTGTGGTAPYTFSITGAPAGLTAVGGTISGTPTTPGTYPISVRVTDSTPSTPRSVTINPNIVVSGAPLTISPTSVPPATAGAPYSQTFSASGGTGPYTWSISGLPSGLSATGPAINGTVSATALGSFPLAVKVTDSATPTPASTTITPTLSVGAAPLTISTTSAPASTVGAPYTLSLVAIGGTGPYSWSISGALPDGLTRTGATISGTPTRQGAFSFIVQVTDSAPTPQTASGSLSIQVNPPVLTVTSTSLPGGTVGVPYNQTLSATGGAGAYSWSITGNLPAGLSLSGATISGTPSSAGSASFVVHVADSGSPVQNAQQSLSIAIAPASLVITTGSLPGATATIAYNQTLAAGGGTPPFAWSVASGSQLPTGLSLSGGGTISGTPRPPGM